MIIETKITLQDFIKEGGVLTPEREIFNVDGKFIGYYLEFDPVSNCHLLSNTTYKKFPILETMGFVKVKAKVLINS